MEFEKQWTFIAYAMAFYFARLAIAECPLEMQGRCHCGLADYNRRLQYVVNCTDSGFNNVNALKNLPAEIEVLIFTGNNIPELPWNVFGTLQNYTQLRIVDMTNNQIREIKGKSYHHVANVERLILNHNRISIAEELHHPRIFSNFVNLEELHLTNAFEDNLHDLGIDLHDIFVSSNLTKLLKLHLEQNEVSTFLDRQVFCDLPKLMDLHLGQNKLTGIEFDIDCLKNLRYIDLEENNIVELTEKDIEELEQLPQRGQELRVELNHNPFLCSCGNEKAYSWLARTNVTIQNKNSLACDRVQKAEHQSLSCHRLLLMEPGGQHPASVTVFTVLSVTLVLVIAIFAYHNREKIRKKVTPMVSTVSRQVHYSTIGNNDDQEVAV